MIYDHLFKLKTLKFGIYYQVVKVCEEKICNLQLNNIWKLSAVLNYAMILEQVLSPVGNLVAWKSTCHV